MIAILRSQVAPAAWSALQRWGARNVSFSLLLAVLTEVPRWTFAFRAINEPLWAGVPLAILIAFATAHAWEEFFAEHDRLLLTLNATSLFFAVATIAPVLYAMTDRQAHEVNIALLFPVALRWVWATILACTTFLPLIQLAVVEARRVQREGERRVLRVVAQRATPQPIAQIEETPAMPVVAERDELIATAQRLRNEGATCKAVADQIGKTASWVSRYTEAV